MRSSKFIVLLVVGVFMTAWLIPLNSMAQAQMVKWKEIIGLIEPGNTVGSGTGQVTGGGEPWSASNGAAKVNLKTGKLEFTVKGLVFAGGRFIGTPGPVTEVKGTLVCNATGTGNSVLVDTSLVPLDEEGDANFNGHVSLDPACFNGDIAFLIRIGANLWIANGAVRSVTH